MAVNIEFEMSVGKGDAIIKNTREIVSYLLENNIFTPVSCYEGFKQKKFEGSTSEKIESILNIIYKQKNINLVSKGEKEYVFIACSEDKHSNNITISLNKVSPSILEFYNKIVLLMDIAIGFVATSDIKLQSEWKTENCDGYTEQTVSLENGYLDGLTNAYWQMWFGQEYVELIGKERLDQAPVYERRYENGIYFVQLFETPYDWNTPAGLQKTDDFKDAVGRDMFFNPKDPYRKLRVPTFSA